MENGWAVSDFDFRTTYKGDAGTMRINAIGEWVGGRPSRTFMTADGPQLDEGDPAEIDIDEITLLFTRDRDDMDIPVNFSALTFSERENIKNIITDVSI